MNKDLIRIYLKNQELLKKIKLENDNIKKDIIANMNNEEEYEDNLYLITNKIVKTKRLDTKLFKVDQKELYEKYLVTSISKRFILKEG